MNTICTREEYPDMIAFEEAIFQNPVEISIRLAYADWAEEQDDHDFAGGLRRENNQSRVDQWVHLEEINRGMPEPNYFTMYGVTFDRHQFTKSIYFMTYGGYTLRDAMTYWIRMSRSINGFGLVTLPLPIIHKDFIGPQITIPRGMLYDTFWGIPKPAEPDPKKVKESFLKKAGSIYKRLYKPKFWKTVEKNRENKLRKNSNGRRYEE